MTRMMMRIVRSDGHIDGDRNVETEWDVCLCVSDRNVEREWGGGGGEKKKEPNRKEGREGREVGLLTNMSVFSQSCVCVCGEDFVLAGY